MDVTSILASLNTAQHQAVTSDQQHLLVLAGAGSGKTRVLVHRIAWKIQVDNISPHSILAVTFTNKASREMRERIDQLLGISLRGMWVGTFHGLAHRLLKSHWRDAKLPENFQILDQDDQLRLVKRVMRSMDLDEQRWPPKQAQWWINGQKDEGLRAAHIQEGGDPFLATMLRVYRGYEETCERLGVIDFAELLLRALELWKNHPQVLVHYQQRFKHILVDEFQDTNAVQYAWLRLLAGTTSAVTAVGDDDQSIYGWRGAKVENILSYERDFADTEVVKLEQNYRSTSSILQAANAVIAKNTDRLGKNLWTDCGEGEPIALYAAFNEHDESRYIADRLQSWVNAGNRREDAAILYRSNAQSRVLEAALLQAEIPYRIYGGQRFYERMEIKNALSYLRLMLNCHDDVAFERVVNVPPRGIGERTLASVRELARDRGCSLWSAAQAVISEKQLTARAANAIDVFLQLVNEMSGQLDELSLAEQAENAIQHSGLVDMHQREKGERGQARVENLEELISACRNFEAEDKDLPVLPQFLDQVALDAGDRQAEEDQDAVQLMTLHSAKGLEFPLVFIAGVEENLFPHKMSLDEPGRLEEERRLAYVGITRAMEKLVLTFAESRSIYGSESFNSVSRFVRDIPREVIEEVRLQNTITRPTSYASGGIRSDQGDETGFQLGQQVNHQVYGEGVILNFEGNGPRARVHVRFEQVGTKILILASANLVAV
ncbi:DNA helicase II [Porticoccaceae bacterium]|nr:DNA helicase II [Porticoccaceae bacterium]MDA8681523.1 DNA helicase II [Porticoccaceae bacterium]MDB2635254.1 DNA helicase II [Porticoccaceae bacterium]MDB2664366.1 DNA helicase II [Porticoccaceae bacterium]MDC0494485.1 DNA helicase II [bacterium]